MTLPLLLVMRRFDQSGTTLKPHIRLRTAARRSVENEGLPVAGIGRTSGLVHMFPGRRHQQARQIAADEGRATALPGRHVERTQTHPCWTIDVDTAATPARVPDQ